MKIFILLAIIFFSFRVFSADDYYYEGRYYKIDEYIRFQDDPNYQAYLNEKKIEARTHRAGVDEYFVEREKAAQIQEQSRLKHLEAMERMPKEEDLSKLEAQYEKQKEEEAKRNALAAQQYLAQRDLELSKAKPSRMIASVFETEQDTPLKRVPREKRKYQIKPKAPSRSPSRR